MSTVRHAAQPNSIHEDPEGYSPHRKQTIVLACLGVFVSYLPVVGVSTALPAIQQALGASTASLQWITDAFIIPTTALILTFGVIGDLLGRKRVYLTGLGLSVAGCLVAITASGVDQLYVGQALAGAGTAALMASTIGLITHVCPDGRTRTRAIAAWTASLALGLTLGPLFDGQILEHVGWRWIYLPGLVLGAAATLIGANYLTDSRADRELHHDLPGQVMVIIGITCLVFGFIEGGGTGGWTSPLVVCAFAAAFMAIAGFIAVELESPNPMFDLRLFRSREFAGAAIATAVLMFAQVGMVFSLSEYFGLVEHASAWDVGVRLVAINGLTVVLAPAVGRLTGHLTRGLVLFAGLVIAGAGALLVTRFEASTSAGTIMLVIAVMGVGIALAMPTITSVAIDSVPRGLASTAGSSNSALRQIGSALGPAIFGVLLTNRIVATLPTHLAASGLNPVDQGNVTGMVSTEGIQVGAYLQLSTQQATGQAITAYSESFTDALHSSALVSGVAILAAALISAFFIGVRHRAD